MLFYTWFIYFCVSNIMTQLIISSSILYDSSIANSYVVVENLRYFLSGFNTTEPLWFGHKIKLFVKQGYFSGGAGEIFPILYQYLILLVINKNKMHKLGYVLSKEAAKRFVEHG